MFSLAPLRARVGADVKVRIVSDASLWHSPKGPPTVLGGPLTRFSPSGDAWTVFVAPPLLAPNGSVLSLGGIDATNTGWIINMFGANRAKWESEGSFLDSAIKAFIQYAPKIIAAIVAVAAPGVGTLFAGAIIAWQSLASGQSLSDALINGSRQAFSTPSAVPAFNDGLSAIKSGLSESTIASLKSKLVGAAFDPDVIKAFESAVTLGRARQVQDVVLAAIRPHFDDAQWNVVQTALDKGGKLYDALYGVGADRALSLLAGTNQTVSSFVQKNAEHPAAIAAAIADPSSAGISATFSTDAPSSASAPSSSSFAPLVAGGVLLGAGYFLWKKHKHQW